MSNTGGKNTQTNEIEPIHSTENSLHTTTTNLPLTAFGDLRVAELTPVMQLTFAQTVTNTEIGTIDISGTGALTQENGMAKASTGTTAGSVAEWLTTRHSNYRAGLGGLFRGTAMFTTGVAGSEQMLGMADENGTSSSHENGFAVGYNGATFSFNRWSDDVIYSIAQTTWDDPMDGTGASGMTLDPTKLNVYFIQFQYLGAGAITLWIESDVTGQPVKAHTLHYTNRNTVPSVINPNFHLMLHVLSTSSTTDLVAKSVSMAYFVEGKTKHTELQQPQFSSGKQSKSTVTTEVAIFTIRNKTTYASKVNFLDLILERISASIEASSANNLGEVRLVRNATLGGTPSYTDVHATNSLVEIDVAGTTVTGGKDILDDEFAGKNKSNGVNLTPYDIILGPGETLTIAGSSANSATFNASLLWKELF